MDKEAVSGFEYFINRYSWGRDKTAFLSLTVKEFLWGYPSLIMSLNWQNECIEKVEVITKVHGRYNLNDNVSRLEESTYL